MPLEDKISLKWNDFHLNIQESYRLLRDDSHFSDVTLSCEGSHTVEAHKVILATSSPFFSRTIDQAKHPHPFIYLRGVDAQHLETIIDFIYRGEVTVKQDDLDQFLEIARELEIKGLSERPDSSIEETSHDNQNEPNIAPSPLKTKLNQNSNKLVSIQNNMDIKVEPHDANADIVSADDVFPNDLAEEVETFESQPVTGEKVSVAGLANKVLDEEIESLMEKCDVMWKCTKCGKEHKNKSFIKTHIEAKHTEGGFHPCDVCKKNIQS